MFLVRDGVLATPPLTDDVLPGITRRAVITLALDAGYLVEERKIDRTELYLADELFLTGTGAQLAPVASIDGRPIGDGSSPIALEIARRYFAAVRASTTRLRPLADAASICQPRTSTDHEHKTDVHHPVRSRRLRHRALVGKLR